MSDLSDYPKQNDEGKVLNPLTGNWVKRSYAKKQDILEQAEQNTQQHFKEQDSSTESDADEIDRLLREAENLDANEAFDIDEESLDALDDDELERLDEHAEINHPELPDSPFPNEEDFSAEENSFEQPPTPEGLEDAARNQQSSGEHKGIYSGKNAGGHNPQTQQIEESNEKNLQQKHDDNEVRYVKTEQGGMKMVYPNEDNE